MYKLWCEFEYGQEDLVFTSKEAAWKWLEWVIEDITIEEIKDDGLAGVVKLEVIS